MVDREVIANPYLIAAWIMVFGLLIYQGRIAAALGGYLAVWNWMYNVDIGPYALLRVFALTLVCTAGVAAFRKRGSLGRTMQSPQIIAFVLLVAIWTLWVYSKVVFSSSQYASDIFKDFVIYTLLPMALLLVFINKIENIRELALSFVLYSTWAAIASALAVQPASLGKETTVVGLGGLNYLTFSWGLSIAILFSMGLFLTARNKLAKALFLAMAAICGVVMLMTGARQSVVALVAALVYICWVMTRKYGKFLTVLTIATIFMGLACLVYLGTDLGQGLLSEKWNRSDQDAAIRQQYWAKGWEVFLEHPTIGAGFGYIRGETSATAHNLIIDVLASEGLVGLLFLTGFLWLIAITLRRWSIQPMELGPEMWKTTLISIMVFTAVHSFASGSTMSEPEFFWAPFLLMQLLAITEQKNRLTKPPFSFSAVASGGHLGMRARLIVGTWLDA